LYHTAEEFINEPTLPEVRRALRTLKNNKAPGTDRITAELIKSGGPTLEANIHKIILNI
jgi:uncharacterized radical SAM superfamily Fe-S cluster-containing enzyme